MPLYIQYTIDKGGETGGGGVHGEDGHLPNSSLWNISDSDRVGKNQLFTESPSLKYVLPHHSKLGSNVVVIYQVCTQGIHFTQST